jgi:hypothetical protein
MADFVLAELHRFKTFPRGQSTFIAAKVRVNVLTRPRYCAAAHIFVGPACQELFDGPRHIDRQTCLAARQLIEAIIIVVKTI